MTDCFVSAIVNDRLKTIYFEEGGETMKANRNKLEIAMAKACMSTAELQKAAEMPRPTLNNVISGKSAKPATIGRIARALGVDVTEILETEN